MRISDHFTLEELTVSQEAARRGIPNVPNQAQTQNLVRLCETILEPLRNKVGGPIVVTSGFRSIAVNSFIGGSKTSDHCDGRAADILVPGKTPLQVCQIIAALNLPYKQVIHEFGQWCHVSIGAKGVKPKREMLTAKRDVEGKVFYLKGLI